MSPPAPARGAADAAALEALTSPPVPVSPEAQVGSAATSNTTAGAELPWLSPSRIGAAVRAHHGDFQACQALGDLESRREDGAVTVGWAVQANGSIAHVTVGPSTFGSARVNACVLEVAKQVTFPPSAAPSEVSWTLEFRGAPRGPLAEASVR